MSPVQAIDHFSHSVDETLVFLRVTDDEAVELLHVGVHRVQGRRLSATCTATAPDTQDENAAPANGGHVRTAPVTRGYRGINAQSFTKWGGTEPPGLCVRLR